MAAACFCLTLASHPLGHVAAQESKNTTEAPIDGTSPGPTASPATAAPSVTSVLTPRPSMTSDPTPRPTPAPATPRPTLAPSVSAKPSVPPVTPAPTISPKPTTPAPVSTASPTSHPTSAENATKRALFRQVIVVLANVSDPNAGFLTTDEEKSFQNVMESYTPQYGETFPVHMINTTCEFETQEIIPGTPPELPEESTGPARAMLRRLGRMMEAIIDSISSAPPRQRRQQEQRRSPRPPAFWGKQLILDDGRSNATSTTAAHAAHAVDRRSLQEFSERDLEVTYYMTWSSRYSSLELYSVYFQQFVNNNKELVTQDLRNSNILKVQAVKNVTIRVRPPTTPPPTPAPAPSIPTIPPAPPPTLAPATSVPTNPPALKPSSDEPTLAPTTEEPTFGPTPPPTLAPTPEPTPAPTATEVLPTGAIAAVVIGGALIIVGFGIFCLIRRQKLAARRSRDPLPPPRRGGGGNGNANGGQGRGQKQRREPSKDVFVDEELGGAAVAAGAMGGAATAGAKTSGGTLRTEASASPGPPLRPDNAPAAAVSAGAAATGTGTHKRGASTSSALTTRREGNGGGSSGGGSGSGGGGRGRHNRTASSDSTGASARRHQRLQHQHHHANHGRTASATGSAHHMRSSSASSGGMVTPGSQLALVPSQQHQQQDVHDHEEQQQGGNDDVDPLTSQDDDFDSFKDQNIEAMRTEVGENVKGTDEMMSQAVTRALISSEEASDVWGNGMESVEIEAAVLHETYTWMRTTDASIGDRRVFMQDQLNKMVLCVRNGFVPSEQASRTIHECAALLGLEIAEAIPRTSLMVTNMRKAAEVEDLIEAFETFGAVREAAVAPNESGFGLVRYASHKGVSRAMEQFRMGEIIVQDVAVRVLVIGENDASLTR